MRGGRVQRLSLSLSGAALREPKCDYSIWLLHPSSSTSCQRICSLGRGVGGRRLDYFPEQYVPLEEGREGGRKGGVMDEANGK